jgi:hypothetical protein
VIVVDVLDIFCGGILSGNSRIQSYCMSYVYIISTSNPSEVESRRDIATRKLSLHYRRAADIPVPGSNLIEHTEVVDANILFFDIDIPRDLCSNL